MTSHRGLAVGVPQIAAPLARQRFCNATITGVATNTLTPSLTLDAGAPTVSWIWRFVEGDGQVYDYNTASCSHTLSVDGGELRINPVLYQYITLLDCRNDSVNFAFRLSDLPSGMTYLHLSSTSSTITGALSDPPSGMTYLHLGNTSSTITGALSDPPSGMTYLHLGNTSSTITGALSDPPSGITTLYLGSTSSTITGGAVAVSALGIREVQIQNITSSQANVDDVIDRLYTDRALFTYATPTLNVGGSNSAPSASPEIDTYIPALQSEGWTVTYTSP